MSNKNKESRDLTERILKGLELVSIRLIEEKTTKNSSL